MKKARTEQTITIKIPVDPTAPAEVEFTPGPYAEEAKRLAATPGSGWVTPSTKTFDFYLVDPSGKQVPLKLNAAPIPLFSPQPEPKDDDPRIRFLVNRKILTPKPLRKPRPDAAAYLNKHRKKKKNEAERERLEASFF